MKLVKLLLSIIGIVFLISTILFGIFILSYQLNSRDRQTLSSGESIKVTYDQIVDLTIPNPSCGEKTSAARLQELKELHSSFQYHFYIPVALDRKFKLLKERNQVAYSIPASEFNPDQLHLMRELMNIPAEIQLNLANITITSENHHIIDVDVELISNEGMINFIHYNQGYVSVSSSYYLSDKKTQTQCELKLKYLGSISINHQMNYVNTTNR